MVKYDPPTSAAADILEGQLGSGAVASARAAALVRVRGAHGHLLHGQVVQQAGSLGDVGLHNLERGEYARKGGDKEGRGDIHENKKKHTKYTCPYA